MTKIAELVGRAEQADSAVADLPSYHGSQIELHEQYLQSESMGRQSLRKGEFEPDTKLTSRPATVAQSINALGALSHIDMARHMSPDILEFLAEAGTPALQQGVDRSNPLLRRGRMQVDMDGFGRLPLKDSSELVLDKDIQNKLATNSFRMDQAFSFRSSLVLPEELAQKFHVTSRNPNEFSEPENRERGKYVQSGYELMLALAILRRDNEETYQSLIKCSTTLESLGSGQLKPMLAGLSTEYQLQFATAQKDLAWAWRNQLEPGKQDRPVPELSERDMLFRNQMGLGMLEYLLPAGKVTLEYLRAFGQKLVDTPFRRTEIKEEHLNEFLVGVPLQDGAQLTATPELLLYLAREHHELWRFCREVSWLVSDTAFHQPERWAHVPWSELDTATKNRDILNIFGVAYMLGQMAEDDFNTLASVAAPGNPLEFSFMPIEIKSK